MQENKNEKVNENERAPGMKPRLALYHANAKGTGCAITVKLAFDDLTKMQQVFRMHRRSLLRREHRRRRPAGRASVCASASRSTANTVSGNALSMATRR